MSQTPNDILEPLPERSRASISLTGVMVGLVLGLAVGLFYAWQIDPIVVTNTSPADLRAADKHAYIISIAQEYTASQDLQRAITRLIEVEPEQNPFQVAALTACQMIRGGEVDDLGDIDVIRSLRSLYEPQGIQADCDTSAFNTPVPVNIVQPSPTVTFTPSITPVASKTPTQVIDPAPASTAIVNTTTQSGAFREAFVEAFCDPGINGVIEVYVRDDEGLALPGTAVQVTDSDRNRYTFYTGLKPDRGDEYADFTMEAGETYRVVIPDQGQPSQPIEALACDESGTITSYRVVIQREAPDDEAP